LHSPGYGKADVKMAVCILVAWPFSLENRPEVLKLGVHHILDSIPHPIMASRETTVPLWPSDFQSTNSNC
jgi:hypothetical protein